MKAPVAKAAPETKETFGDRVRHLRTARGLSQRKLAQSLRDAYPGKMRVTYSAIHAWQQRGKQPKRAAMILLAEFFSVEPQSLQFALSINTTKPPC